MRRVAHLSAAMPSPTPYSFSNLTRPASLARLGGIGAMVLALAAAFAGTAGWFSPSRLGPDAMIDRFEDVNGEHPGFRRNHAKGVCLTGSFESNGNAARLSTAPVFAPGRTPVIGRFALAGGMPTMADGPAAVRSLALEFQMADGQQWRTGMNDIPVFPMKDPQAFYEQLSPRASAIRRPASQTRRRCRLSCWPIPRRRRHWI